MNIIRNIIFLIIFAALLLFTFLNYEFKVDVNIVGHLFKNIPLALVVLYAFLSGVIITYLLTFLEWIHQKSIISKLNKERANLKKELDKLRNLPFVDKNEYILDDIEIINKEDEEEEVEENE